MTELRKKKNSKLMLWLALLGALAIALYFFL